MNRVLSIDREGISRDERVLVRCKEDELPSPLLPALRDHTGDPLVCVLPAGVLHPVRENRHNDRVRPLRRGEPVDPRPQAGERPSDRVEERRRPRWASLLDGGRRGPFFFS